MQPYVAVQGGAALQFERGQLNCGVELCMLLVEACTTDEAEPCEVSRLEELLLMFPTEAEREGDEPPIESAVKVVGAGMRWLRRCVGARLLLDRQQPALCAVLDKQTSWERPAADRVCTFKGNFLTPLHGWQL